MTYFKYIMLVTFVVIVSCNEKDPIIKEEETELPDKCCSCLEEQGISDKYIYPYTIEDLRQFDDYRVKLEVCQIPADTLINICTHGLVDTYYDFPLLFSEIFSAASVKMGLKRMESTYNGFHELISREDAPDKLFKKYKAVDPSNLDSITDAIEKGILQFQINFQEITIGYDSISGRFSSEERRAVLEFGLKVLEDKRKHNHDNFSHRCTLYLLGNILLKEEYLPLINSMDSLGIGNIINGLVMPASTIYEIEYHARSYLNEISDN